MSNQKITYRRQIIAVACAILCGFSGLGMASAKTIVGDTGGLAVEEIDTSRTGSLTILLTPLNPHDEIPEGELPPGGLEGTTFTVHRISGIDLSTAEGWREAENLSMAEARDADFDFNASATTDEWGRAVFDDLPVGVYFVTATTPDDGEHAYRQPQDMVVTIPMGEDSQWKYGAAVVAKYDPSVTTPPSTPEFPPVTTTPAVPTEPTPDTPGTPATTTPGTPGTPATTDPAGPPAERPGPPGGGEGPISPAGPSPHLGIDRLPTTGAAVIWSVAIAVILLATGAALLIANNRRRKNSIADM